MHDALTRTLAAGTARVRRLRCTTAGELITAEEGVTDFAARRTHMAPTASPGVEQIAAAFEARWPWLHEDEDPDAPLGVSVYAGTTHVFGIGDDPAVISRGTPHAPMRCHTDPVWILEVLARAHVTSDESTFAIDLTRRTGPLQLPPYHGSAPPRLAGEVELDDAGRLRRVTWRRTTYRRRPRWPGTPPTGAGRETLELWDFGLPVEIAVPDLPRRLPGTALVDIVQAVWYLRRRRREWMRHAPG